MHKKTNSYSKKNIITTHNIFINNNSPNLFQIYEKPKNHSEIHRNNKQFHKIIQKPSKVKIIFTQKTPEQNYLFKYSPKILLSSLENNVLLGKITQKKNHILPKIYNNKIMLLNSNMKYKKSHKEIKNKTENNSIKKDKYFFASSYNFNPQKSIARNYYNIYKEINLYKTNDDLCKNESTYTSIIRPENCGYLIRNCFNHRKNWKEIETLESPHFNFKWQQNTKGIDYNDLSI
jgi:hypothetical protein